MSAILMRLRLRVLLFEGDDGAIRVLRTSFVAKLHTSRPFFPNLVISGILNTG